MALNSLLCADVPLRKCSINQLGIPGHFGIKSNEQADDVAKMALHSSISAVKYPPSDLYHDVTSLCYKLFMPS